MPRDDHAFEFGPFRLVPARRLLLKDGAPLSLGSRAMDLLLALVEHAGGVLSRKELESRAWPGLCVEETSLRVHVHALRRALQDGLSDARYITNLPGRGYCFVAPVVRVMEAPAAGGAPALKLVFSASTSAATDDGVRPALRSVARCLADLYRLDGAARTPSAVAEASELVALAGELLASAARVLGACSATGAQRVPQRPSP